MKKLIAAAVLAMTATPVFAAEEYLVCRDFYEIAEIVMNFRNSGIDQETVEAVVDSVLDPTSGDEVSRALTPGANALRRNLFMRIVDRAYLTDLTTQAFMEDEKKRCVALFAAAD